MLRAAAVFGVLAAPACSDAILPQLTTWEGSIEPMRPGAPRGSLAALSQAGRTNTSLQLTLGQAGTTYAWRIQSGSCTEPGETVGGRAAYPTMVPGPDGSATDDTSLSRELSPDGTYAGWIYVVSGEEETAVSCGDLLRTR